MKTIILFFSISFIANITQAQVGVYKLDVERNGVTYQQVAGDFWQGEYPGPAIDINSKKKKGETTIQGWESLRKLNVRKNCTVKNGLYHPWSNSADSLINFYTIAGVADYVVTKELTEDLQQNLYDAASDAALPKINVGDKIINTFYLSEGVSMGILVQGNKQTEINFYSGVFEENPETFAVLKKTDSLIKTTYEDGEVLFENEQWLYLECSEGYNVFVQDSDLLSQKGIKEGEVTGYGEVSPAE